MSEEEKAEAPAPQAPVPKVVEVSVLPPGFRQLEGEEFQKYHDASMRRMYFRERLDHARTRVQMHTHGLEAAQAAVRGAQADCDRLEMEMGLHHETLGVADEDLDVKVIRGMVFVRKRGKEDGIGG